MTELTRGRWEVPFFRARNANPVVEELLALRRRNVRLAAEVILDLKDLEEFGLELPEKRLHKVKGTPLWELRSKWQHSIVREARSSRPAGDCFS